MKCNFNKMCLLTSVYTYYVIGKKGLRLPWILRNHEMIHFKCLELSLVGDGDKKKKFASLPATVDAESWICGPWCFHGREPPLSLFMGTRPGDEIPKVLRPRPSLRSDRVPWWSTASPGALGLSFFLSVAWSWVMGKVRDFLVWTCHGYREGRVRSSWHFDFYQSRHAHLLWAGLVGWHTQLSVPARRGLLRRTG